MNQLLLIVLLLLSGSGYGQTYRRMKAFEDYDQCYTGFLNKYNRHDTIFQPQFESIKYWDRLMKQDEHIWVVCKEGKCGILDASGNYVVDHIYDSIFVYDNRRDLYVFGMAALVVYNDGLYGVIDYQGNEVFPLEYKNLEVSELFSLKMRLANNLEGIYKVDANRFVVPPIYHSVTFRQIPKFDDYYYGKSFNYYSVTKDGKKGVVDLNGNELVPPKYSDVEIVFQEKYCENSPLWFRIWNNKKVGLMNPRGEIVLEPMYEALDIHFQFVDSCGGVEVSVMTKHQGKFQLHTINTNSSSEPYDKMYHLGMQGLVIEKNRWYIIGENGPEYRGKNSMTPIAKDIAGESKILVGTKVKQRRKFDPQKYDHGSIGTFGLYDYTLDKKTPIQYNRIDINELQGSYYYWLLQWQRETRLFDLDIYNEKMELIHSMKISGIGIDNYFSRWWEDDQRKMSEQIIVVKDASGYLGALNAKGETVIPLVHSDLKVDVYQSTDYDARPVIHKYNFYTDSTHLIYAADGKLLSPDKYEKIELFEDSLWLGTYGDRYDFMDGNFKILLEGCEAHGEKPQVSDEKWMQVYYKFRATRHNYFDLQWAIKDNKYYFLLGNKWHLMDSTYLDFTDKKYVMIANSLVDESGEIVFGKEHHQTGRQILNHYYLFGDNVLRVLDLNGKEVWRMENLYTYQYKKDGEIHVNLINGTSGIYNIINTRWILKPKYLEYRECFIEGRTGLTWVKEQDEQSGEMYWKIIDSGGKEVVPIHFDEIFGIRKYDNFVVFKSNGLQGLINKNLEVVFDAKYEFVRKEGATLLFKHEGKWGFTNSQGDLVEPQFDNMGTKVYPKGRLVFESGDLVGVINYKGEWIIPLCPQHVLLDKYDLADTLYGISRYGSSPYIRSGLIFAEDSMDIYRQINNENIYQDNYMQSANATFYPRYLGRTLFLSSDPINDVQRRQRTEVTHISVRYYAAKRVFSESFWDSRQRTEVERDVYLNYQISENDKTPLVFDDLFLGPRALVEVDEILMDIFNKEQIFGIACIDKQKVINEAKREFLLTEKGILLINVTWGKDVLLPYGRFMSALKHPECF